jgi:hypothetical protein
VRRAPLHALAVAALASLAGCGDEELVTPPVQAELRVGTAQADGVGFLAIPDFTEVDLVPGAQGGFHVWVNVSLHGVAGPITIEREARREADGELVLRALAQRIDVPEDAMVDWWDNPNAAPAFMCPTPIGLSVIGEPIRINVTIRGTDDEVLAEESMVVIPRCNLQPEFCQSICSG